jgi:hypothetical protein
MQTRQPISPWVKFFFGRLFPWPFILSGALALFVGARNCVRAYESINWPTTRGIVQTSSVEYRSGTKGGGTYHAHVLYNYNLNGTAFSRDRVAYGDYGSSNPSHAQEIVNRYPVGKNVTIYYMPSRPEECLLEPGIKLQAWAIPVFGMLFLSIGIAMLVFIPKMLEKACQAQRQLDPANTPS